MIDNGNRLLTSGLKLRHLQLLDLLQETGQLGLAAAQMGIAQPAASRLLSEIETILGRPVHERLGRGLALTAAGQTLARRAARMFLELRDAEREIESHDAGQSGHVRIGSVTGPAMDRILPALQKARHILPGVTTEITVGPSDLLVRQLLAGALDFALGRPPRGADRALLSIQVIEPEPVALMVRRGHKLQGCRNLRPEDLMEFDWVFPGAEVILGRTVLARLAACGLPHPPQRISTSSFLLTLALVQQSDAIAPLARAVVRTFASGPDAPFALLPIDLGIEVESFSLLRRQGAALPPVAENLLAMVLAPPADSPRP
ncbi:MAG: LysR family transcriptional regulator [Pseudorhodobacter sp.]